MVNKKKICFKREGVRWLVSKMPYSFRLVHYIGQEALIEAKRRFPKRPPIVHDLNCIAKVDLSNILLTPLSEIIKDKPNE